MKGVVLETIVPFKWSARDAWIRRGQYLLRLLMIFHVFRSIIVLDARLYAKRRRMRRNGGG